jgi:hypothetical protein
MSVIAEKELLLAFMKSTFYVRRLIPLVSYRLHRKLINWMVSKARITKSGRERVVVNPKPYDVFMFKCSDLTHPKSAHPGTFARTHCETGIVFQENHGMAFCFVGTDYLSDMISFCIKEKIYPPVIAQAHEYQYDSGPTGSTFVANFMHIKHFSNWFYFYCDKLDIPVGPTGKPLTVLSCNPTENGIMWFSQAQMDLHVTLLTLSVIDYMINPPPEDVRYEGAYSEAFQKLKKETAHTSTATLYMYVKFIMESKITYMEDGDNGIYQDYLYETLDVLDGYHDLEDDQFASQLYRHTGGWPSTPTTHPLSAIPLIPPKSYLSDIQSIRSNSKKDPLMCSHNPYTLPAIQVTEVVRWLLKVCFSHHLRNNMDPFMIHGSTVVQPDFKKICESLSCHVKLGMSQRALKKLHESATLLFSLPRGQLTHLYRLFMGATIEVVPADIPLSHKSYRLFVPPNGDSRPSDRNKCIWANKTVLEGMPVHQKQYQYRQTNTLSVPPSLLSVRKTITQKHYHYDFNTLFSVRLRIPYSGRVLETRAGNAHCERDREIYIDMTSTHFSMNDILTTLTFYQLRLPFLPRSTVSITYDLPGICTIRLPEGGKERVQKYMPVWMHYMQLAPQKTIMAPLLFHNYLHALQTNDISGMLTVAESIFNLVSGTAEVIPICTCNPTTGCWEYDPKEVAQNGYSSYDTTANHSASIVSDAFVTHMGSLSILMGTIDYHMAIETIYADSRNFVSKEASERLNEYYMGSHEINLEEPCIRSSEAIHQLAPHLSNIYSALRSFIHVTEPHLISYRVLDTIVSRFRNDIGNSISFPIQAQVIGFLTVLTGKNENNFYIRETGEKFLCIPPYYPPPSSANGGMENDYDVVPLAIHFYPLIYIATAGFTVPDEVMDFFFGIRLFREMSDYLYQKDCPKTPICLEAGNCLPPKFAYNMSELQDIFYTYARENIVPTPESSGPSTHHNPTTPAYCSFYHLLYYTELLSHIPCAGVVPDDIRSMRVTSESDYLSYGKRDIPYRGIPNIDAALAIHIQDMTPFEFFRQYAPEDTMWSNATNSFHQEQTTDPMAYDAFFNSDLDTVSSKEGEEWASHFSRDACHVENTPGELFPFLSICVPQADPTSVTNEDGPLFGADPFIPFALSIAPVTHMGIAGLIISDT